MDASATTRTTFCDRICTKTNRAATGQGTWCFVRVYLFVMPRMHKHKCGDGSKKKSWFPTHGHGPIIFSCPMYIHALIGYRVERKTSQNEGSFKRCLWMSMTDAKMAGEIRPMKLLNKPFDGMIGGPLRNSIPKVCGTWTRPVPPRQNQLIRMVIRTPRHADANNDADANDDTYHEMMRMILSQTVQHLLVRIIYLEEMTWWWNIRLWCLAAIMPMFRRHKCRNTDDLLRMALLTPRMAHKDINTVKRKKP